MKTIFFSISTIILLFVGCNTTTEKDGTITLNSGKKLNPLGTLGLSSKELKEVVFGKNWTKLNLDLDDFITQSIETPKQDYVIDLNFKDNNILAYADGQKITATFKIDGDKLSFSKIIMEADLDHSYTNDFMDADQALYSFLNGSYKATKIEENLIVLKSEETDSEVTLKRD